jgi:hypothetical protein
MHLWARRAVGAACAFKLLLVTGVAEALALETATQPTADGYQFAVSLPLQGRATAAAPSQPATATAARRPPLPASSTCIG